MQLTDPYLVKINNLSFYRDHHCIFDQVNIDLMRGKVTAIIGPSGVGKTTLLHLIGRKLQPAAGSIHFMVKICRKLNPRIYLNCAKKLEFYFKTQLYLQI